MIFLKINTSARNFFWGRILCYNTRHGQKSEITDMSNSYSLDLLKTHEGLRLFPYLDSQTKISIGYGRNLTDNGIRKIEAEFLFANDVKLCEHELEERVSPYKMASEPTKVVLLNMCYNLGLPRLLKFSRMLSAISRNDYRKAADEMLDSLWARQVGRRAEQLATMMREQRFV